MTIFWVTFLVQSPPIWINNPSFEVHGRSYRVVVTTAEIYNRLFIEEITSGDEGCCVKVASIKKVDLEQLATIYGFRGELTGFKFIRWRSPTNFEFLFHGRSFLASEIDKGLIKLKEIIR